MTDSASSTGSSTDPLSQLAETPVERTTSEAHPEAMPPVAGAADPHVLADGLTDRCVEDPERPDIKEA